MIKSLTGRARDVFSRKLNSWISTPDSRDLFPKPNLFARSAIVPATVWRAVERINSLVDEFHEVPDEDLQSRISQIRIDRLQLNDVQARDRVFAIATEALRRVHGIRLYDVQLFAGLVMTSGCIAEMQTGEGKTFSVIPTALYFSLFDEGVHVATTNPYLAGRDRALVSPVLEFLGLSCGLVQPNQSRAAARRAYHCDVTYGPGYQFGFDYLADQVTLRKRMESRLGERILADLTGNAPDAELLQRRKAFCIIDEIDSVLLDEGTTPLLLAKTNDQDAGAAAYRLAKWVVDRLEETGDYVKESGSVWLTDSGFEKIHQELARYTAVPLVRPWCEYVENALMAKFHLQRNRHYVVQDGTVQIVDQNTGRILPDQTWKNGLHQAVEAKEGVEISRPTETIATVSRQRLFSGYGLICGLSGTADGHQKEFHEFYRMAVIKVPTNRPSNKSQLPPRFFADNDTKFRAIVADVAQRHEMGQPVLIGTRSIEDSLRLSECLVEKNISHQVLNGVQDQKEADIIARAGRLGAVTVATNIAGRGTDIKLEKDAMEKQGLHVILAEPHESRRVDRQLIGRCGRQGEPGSWQLFVSADDRIFDRSPALAQRIRRHANQQGEALRDFSRELRGLQLRSEKDAYRKRKSLKVQDQRRRQMLHNFFDPDTAYGD